VGVRPVPEELRVLSTGNEEFDIKIGGGLPYPSLVVIEGGHGTGKTALSLLFLLGALRAGIASVVFNSEYRPLDYVRKAAASGFPLEDYYIRGLLRVYSIQYPGELTREVADMIASRLIQAVRRLSERYGFFVVDSLSYFGSISSPPLLNEVVVTLRDTASSGRGVIVTVHSDSLPPEIMRELAASADGYLKISPAVVGGKRLKVLSIVKLRGAPPGIETTITFDVDPAFGIKLVPIMISQA
jgi:flagellar protein FlaH